MASTIEEKPRLTLKERAAKLGESLQGSQAWNSIFRPGSIFRKGYTDSPRNRSYVIMNSVLYHLHPVKVKRHAVKVSYTYDLYHAPSGNVVGGFFRVTILLTSCVALSTKTESPSNTEMESLRKVRANVRLALVTLFWKEYPFAFPGPGKV